MAQRVTQQVTETTYSGMPRSRVTQQVVEVAETTNSLKARVTQIVLEVIIPATAAPGGGLPELGVGT